MRLRLYCADSASFKNSLLIYQVSVCTAIFFFNSVSCYYRLRSALLPTACGFLWSKTALRGSCRLIDAGTSLNLSLASWAAVAGSCFFSAAVESRLASATLYMAAVQHSLFMHGLHILFLHWPSLAAWVQGPKDCALDRSAVISTYLSRWLTQDKPQGSLLDNSNHVWSGYPVLPSAIVDPANAGSERPYPDLNATSRNRSSH